MIEFLHVAVPICSVFIWASLIVTIGDLRKKIKNIENRQNQWRKRQRKAAKRLAQKGNKS